MLGLAFLLCAKASREEEEQCAEMERFLSTCGMAVVPSGKITEKTDLKNLGTLLIDLSKAGRNRIPENWGVLKNLECLAFTGEGDTGNVSEEGVRALKKMLFFAAQIPKLEKLGLLGMNINRIPEGLFVVGQVKTIKLSRITCSEVAIPKGCSLRHINRLSLWDFKCEKGSSFRRIFYKIPKNATIVGLPAQEETYLKRLRSMMPDDADIEGPPEQEEQHLERARSMMPKDATMEGLSEREERYLGRLRSMIPNDSAFDTNRT